MSEFRDWFSVLVADSNWYVYIKRLSANDTGATGSHQVGIYIPKDVMNQLFPALNRTDILNPELLIPARICSHPQPEQQVRVIYYNNRYFGQTRNEKRITRWGGRNCPLQDPENTGALAVLAFRRQEDQNAELLEGWVCQSIETEDLIESIVGEVLPGNFLFGSAEKIFGGFSSGFKWSDGNYPIPADWNNKFPSGAEIINYLPAIFRFRSTIPDDLLLERRDAEYSVFRKIEELHVLDQIRAGFGSVDAFIDLANSVSNRRKSRAGKSLELHLEQLFTEQALTTFSTQCVTEGNKRPDFIFPSCAAYHDPDWPIERLRMLAVKTTCKDRWRQIISEADRINDIHLFTLQEGVSVNQYQEMRNAGVKLVVPSPLHRKYPEEIRGELISLADFIHETKALYEVE